MRFLKYTTLLFAVVLSSNSFAQSTLQDAIFLRQFITEGEENASTEGYFSENPDEMLQYVPTLKRVLGLENDIDEDRLGQVISDKLFENPKTLQNIAKKNWDALTLNYNIVTVANKALSFYRNCLHSKMKQKTRNKKQKMIVGAS